MKYFRIDSTEGIGAAVDSIRETSSFPEDVFETAGYVIEEVREKGDAAIVELTERFDGIKIEVGDLEVPRQDVEKAWAALEEETKEALMRISERVAEFARNSLCRDWEIEIAPGVVTGQLFRPVSCAGIYVPGGRFPYPSTVLMTGIPAAVAGVDTIVFCIPPARGVGTENATLAAMGLVKNSRVFRVGGAQAIAAMAYGTETIPRCQIIAGPGNVYVTAAKRLVQGEVSIDLEAGPSEIAVLVGSDTNLGFAAGDLLAQLEHDPCSIAVAISESRDVLEALMGVLKGMGEGHFNLEESNLTFVETTSNDISAEFINALAPEHLELMVDDAALLVEKVRCAGSVFVGAYSTVVLGDYVAGPSHVLPTGGSASRLSGLSAQTFRRSMNIVRYDRVGFENDARTARRIAQIEGMKWHCASIDIRSERSERGE